MVLSSYLDFLMIYDLIVYMVSSDILITLLLWFSYEDLLYYRYVMLRWDFLLYGVFEFYLNMLLMLFKYPYGFSILRIKYLWIRYVLWKIILYVNLLHNFYLCFIHTPSW